MNTKPQIWSSRATAYRRYGLAAAFIACVVVHSSQGAVSVTNSPLHIARAYHTTSLLQNGKLLVAGGFNGSAVAITELYDPATGAWTTNGSLATARYQHTATLLPNGKVLVAGGQVAPDVPTNSAELFDPVSGTWAVTSPMNTARYYHTATLLAGGLVLVAGGEIGGDNVTNSAELYNPATGAWTLTGPMVEGRYADTATLLADGTVLAAAGLTPGVNSDAELYDPVAGTWSLTGSMNVIRSSFVATRLPNGQVLAAGGFALGLIPSAELYDPVSKSWTTTGHLNSLHGNATATLLPDGKMCVVSGFYNYGAGLTTNATELFNPATTNWTFGPPLNTGRAFHTATLLPGGQLIIVGGLSGSAYLSSVESILFTTATWTLTNPMSSDRDYATGTLLANGKVLVAGGREASGVLLRGCQLFDPATGIWSATGQLNQAREVHTATLLASGKVLVTGGFDGSNTLASTELYDPATQIWTSGNSMSSARLEATAALLSDGRVLVAGGGVVSNVMFISVSSTAELYDPTTGLWTNTGSLPFNNGQVDQQSVRLSDGRVLVAGGDDSDLNATDAASVYDPATGTWSATGSMGEARASHSMTLLPNGMVLAAGGTSDTSAEVYNPRSGTWSFTGSLNAMRSSHTATLLVNGQVLVAGGDNTGTSAELYDPGTASWRLTTPLNMGRSGAVTALLPSGQVLVAGGGSASPELYDVGLGYSNIWRPQIIGSIASIAPGGVIAINGAQLRGIGEGSGGNAASDSPADYPVVQLRSLENSQTINLLPAHWSSNSFASQPVWPFPPGYSLLTVTANGIPSTSSVVSVIMPAATRPVLFGSTILSNGSFQCFFTNNPGTIFAGVAATNPAMPGTNWTLIGGVTETSPGQFQFTDPQAANYPSRVYRIRLP